MTDTLRIKNHLLGCVDAALFMPGITKRFDGSYDAMIRSFYIPVMMFPLMILTVLLEPSAALADHSQNTISLIHALRFTMTLAIFMGFVYFLATKTDRTKHFFQFVTAYNWLMIPTVLISLPIVLMSATGDAAMINQAQVLSYFVLIYTYAIIAYAAACTLRIPIELAGFVAIIGLQIDLSSYEIIGWVGSF